MSLRMTWNTDLDRGSCKDPPRGGRHTPLVPTKSSHDRNRSIGNTKMRRPEDENEHPSVARRQENEKTPPPRQSSISPMGAMMRRETSRGPLKKRVPSPFPLTPTATPLGRYDSSFQGPPMAPLLRSASSTFSTYSHHSLVPPQVCLTASRGRHLMSQPLLATPSQTPCPSVTPSISGSTARMTRENPLVVLSTNHTTPMEGAGGNTLMDAPPAPASASASLKQDSAIPDMRPLPEQVAPTVNYDNAVTRVETFAIPEVPYSSVASRDVNSSHGFPFWNPPPPLAGAFHQMMPHPVASASRPMPVGSNLAAPRHGSRYRPPSNPVKLYPMLFKDAPTTGRPCKCSQTNCLKLYCECFRQGLLCDAALCRCSKCHNNQEGNIPKSPRHYAILKTLARRPDAFVKTMKKRARCRCPKSQ